MQHLGVVSHVLLGIALTPRAWGRWRSTLKHFPDVCCTQGCGMFNTLVLYDTRVRPCAGKGLRTTNLCATTIHKEGVVLSGQTVKGHVRGGGSSGVAGPSTLSPPSCFRDARRAVDSRRPEQLEQQKSNHPRSAALSRFHPSIEHGAFPSCGRWCCSARRLVARLRRRRPVADMRGRA